MSVHQDKRIVKSSKNIKCDGCLVAYKRKLFEISSKHPATVVDYNLLASSPWTQMEQSEFSAPFQAQLKATTDRYSKDNIGIIVPLFPKKSEFMKRSVLQKEIGQHQVDAKNTKNILSENAEENVSQKPNSVALFKHILKKKFRSETVLQALTTMNKLKALQAKSVAKLETKSSKDHSGGNCGSKSKLYESNSCQSVSVTSSQPKLFKTNSTLSGVSATSSNSNNASSATSITSVVSNSSGRSRSRYYMTAKSGKKVRVRGKKLQSPHQVNLALNILEDGSVDLVLHVNNNYTIKKQKSVSPQPTTVATTNAVNNYSLGANIGTNSPQINDTQKVIYIPHSKNNTTPDLVAVASASIDLTLVEQENKATNDESNTSSDDDDSISLTCSQQSHTSQFSQSDSDNDNDNESSSDNSLNSSIDLISTNSTSISQNNSSITPILVASTHLFWNPRFEDVKFWQIVYFTRVIEVLRLYLAQLYIVNDNPVGSIGVDNTIDQFCMDKIPVILTGDFNSTPNSNVYQYLSDPYKIGLSLDEIKPLSVDLAHSLQQNGLNENDNETHHVVGSVEDGTTRHNTQSPQSDATPVKELALQVSSSESIEIKSSTAKSSSHALSSSSSTNTSLEKLPFNISDLEVCQNIPPADAPKLLLFSSSLRMTRSLRSMGLDTEYVMFSSDPTKIKAVFARCHAEGRILLCESNKILGRNDCPKHIHIPTRVPEGYQSLSQKITERANSDKIKRNEEKLKLQQKQNEGEAHNSESNSNTNTDSNNNSNDIDDTNNHKDNLEIIVEENCIKVPSYMGTCVGVQNSSHPIDARIQYILDFLNFSFDSKYLFTRCTLCNGTFASIPLQHVRLMDTVPDAVKSGYDKYTKKVLSYKICLGCHQVYWWGPKSSVVADRFDQLSGFTPTHPLGNISNNSNSNSNTVTDITDITQMFNILGNPVRIMTKNGLSVDKVDMATFNNDHKSKHDAATAKEAQPENGVSFFNMNDYIPKVDSAQQAYLSDMTLPSSLYASIACHIYDFMKHVTTSSQGIENVPRTMTPTTRDATLVTFPSLFTNYKHEKIPFQIPHHYSYLHHSNSYTKCRYDSNDDI